jgi:hypothetical protein
LAAAALVVASRLLVPGAPALYDGISVAPEPYRYCNPPSNLASSNQKPTDGAGELQASGSTNQLGTVNTKEASPQVLTFFPKGGLQAAGATSYRITIKPECTPPPPPPNNKIVGNAYTIAVLGEPGDLAVTFPMPAQVLLRTPAVQYTSVKNYYDGAWHDTQWGQQQDIANVTIQHSGTLALLDDGSANPKGKPPSQRAPGIVTIVEVVLVSAALGIVVAAIIVQQRRARETTGGKDARKRR